MMHAAIRKITIVPLLLAGLKSGAVAQAAASAPDSTWTTFSSRSGWTMRHPHDWQAFSCQSCPDPRAPDLFVTFAPDSDRSSVMVQPLASRPDTATIPRWLNHLAHTANLDPILSQTRVTVDGAPGLDVRYQAPDSTLMEAVYLVRDAATYSIEFRGPFTAIQPDDRRAYRRFRRMVRSFHIRSSGR